MRKCHQCACLTRLTTFLLVAVLLLALNCESQSSFPIDAKQNNTRKTQKAAALKLSHTMTKISFVSIILAFVALASGAQAFTVAPAPLTTTSTSLGLFGGLTDAFKNDDSLAPAKNAGLSNGPNYNDQVTVNGKAVQGAVVGQKLTVVAGRARVKIPVNCQKGDCGTCMVNFNGRKVKACQTTLGKGKAAIKTL